MPTSPFCASDVDQVSFGGMPSASEGPLHYASGHPRAACMRVLNLRIRCSAISKERVSGVVRWRRAQA